MPKTLLERVLATRPASTPRRDLDRLTLAGQPLPPSLQAVLAHDDAWLPALHPLAISEVALRAEVALEVATEGGRELTADMFSELTPLYPGHCFVIEGPTVVDDEVQISFVYGGSGNNDGELPVLVYWRPADDFAQLVIEAPAVDVWLAQRLNLIKSSRDGKLPKAYHPALQDCANRNFNGCWGHSLSDVVAAHAPHIEDACDYLIAPSSLPRETVALVGGDVDDLEPVLSQHGAVTRNGDILTIDDGVDKLTIDVTASIPPAKRARLVCNTPLAARVVRALLALPNAYIYVGFPHDEPQFLWMLKKSRRLDTSAEIDAWLSSYEPSK